MGSHGSKRCVWARVPRRGLELGHAVGRHRGGGRGRGGRDRLAEPAACAMKGLKSLALKARTACKAMSRQKREDSGSSRNRSSRCCPPSSQTTSGVTTLRGCLGPPVRRACPARRGCLKRICEGRRMQEVASGYSLWSTLCCQADGSSIKQLDVVQKMSRAYDRCSDLFCISVRFSQESNEAVSKPALDGGD